MTFTEYGLDFCTQETIIEIKNGMEKHVSKSNVFKKESLITLQNKMRTLCIE